MHAQFEVGRQSKAIDRITDHSEIFLKFSGELRHITHVVHTFIEASREFGGNGLGRYFFQSNHGEYEQHLNRRLRGFGLIHGDFRNKRRTALFLLNSPVCHSGLLNSE